MSVETGGDLMTKKKEETSTDEEMHDDTFADERYAEEQYESKLQRLESWSRDSRYM